MLSHRHRTGKCGLRDYGVPDQLGLEPTPEEYISKMVEVFREVRRILRKDGTLWLMNRWGGQKLKADGQSSWDKGTGQSSYRDRDMRPNDAGRNKRSVWTIPTQSFSEAHFATFPEKLVEPCIKAGTSEKGCCPECGEPWVRVVEITEKGYSQHDGSARALAMGHSATGPTSRGSLVADKTKTIGWQPGCECGKEPVPCLVYDLFFGSGTVGLVSYKLNRHWLGTELNPVSVSP